MRTSERTWDETWLAVAREIAQRSKDPSTKVGCVLVSPDNRQIAVGYNGFPAGFPDKELYWENRGQYSGVLTKYDIVVHAEMNALLHAKTPVNNWTAYITHGPCPCLNCAKHIAAAGIRRVVLPKGGPTTKMSLDEEKVRQIFASALVELSEC